MVSKHFYQQKNLINKIKLPSISTTLENIISAKINYISLDMESGFIYKNYIFLTANELFQNKVLVKKYKTNFYEKFWLFHFKTKNTTTNIKLICAENDILK